MILRELLLVIKMLVTIVMIIIGISKIRSKKLVGFYTGKKAPKEDELLDVITSLVKL